MSMSSELISACQRRILSYVAPLWWLRTIRGRPYCTEALLSQTYIPNTLPHHDAHTRYSPERSNGRQNRVNGDGFLVNRISNRRESDYNSPATPMTLFEDLNTLWYNYDILGWHVEGENRKLKLWLKGTMQKAEHGQSLRWGTRQSNYKRLVLGDLVKRGNHSL